MSGAVRQIKPAFRGKAFIVSVSKALPGGSRHAIKLRSRSRLRFELANFDEVIEFLLAHAYRSVSEPKMKSLG
jgi:hypothetical protein